MSQAQKPYMQVLVSTYGREGIMKLAQADYPAVEGVEYLVSWQLPDGDCGVPYELAGRKDFRIHKVSSRGLSSNRNETLRLATAPVCVIADDDLHYDADALRCLAAYHRNHPEAAIVCFHITVDGKTMPTYSPDTFDLRHLPRGYWFTSCEISFKREPVIESGVRFCELLGVGAPVIRSGEEELFMRSLLRKGLRGVCLPLVVCDHPGSTTGDRIVTDPSYIMFLGLMLRFRYPRLWSLLLLPKAFLANRYTGQGFFNSIRLLRRGALYAKQMNIF